MEATETQNNAEKEGKRKEREKIIIVFNGKSESVQFTNDLGFALVFTLISNRSRRLNWMHCTVFFLSLVSPNIKVKHWQSDIKRTIQIQCRENYSNETDGHSMHSHFRSFFVELKRRSELWARTRHSYPTKRKRKRGKGIHNICEWC